MSTAMLMLAALLQVASEIGSPDLPDTLQTVVLEGSVMAGEDFTAPIGMGLELRLASIGGSADGWVVEVVDPDFPDEDHALVVTYPYRGTNALQIFPWHFINAAGTGPNDGSTNAPGEDRLFRFVLSRGSYLAAAAALPSILWPESQEEMDQALRVLDSLEICTGTLTIVELELNPSERTIDWLRFRAVLCLRPGD